ncbi:MAG: hypothetical protein GY953_57865, partial [bacterium]|nr:hypothetical protein [bacterium]
ALSTDGLMVAVSGRGRRVHDSWIQDIARSIQTRLTTCNPLRGPRPIWSPTGEQIVFTAWVEFDRKFDVYVRSVKTTEEAKPRHATPAVEVPTDWSPDGKYVVYQVGTQKPSRDLWYSWAEPDGSGYESAPFLETPFTERVAKFSPDGRFLAYCSDESGNDEVYVQPFPQGGEKWRISRNGGTQPRWSRDGRELFYVEHDTMMRVPVTLTPGFSAGSPERLFSHPGLVSLWPEQRYDVSADGQRFIVVETLAPEGDQRPTIHVVQNWFAEFRHRQEQDSP